MWKGEPFKPHPLTQSLEGDESKEFLHFLTGMLRWVPEERKSARELLQHPWLASSTNDGGKEVEGEDGK